jgi:hypothetical protein
MKKIFFAFSLMLLSFVWTVQAQQDVTVRFGGVAGFNMSKWGGDYSDDLKTTFKPGFHIGGVAEMIINPKWSIQPELLFTLQGTNSDVLDKGISAMYIKIPIVVYRSFLIAKGDGRLSPGLGFYCAEGIGGKFNGDQNTFDNVARFDWGLEIKVNYEMQKGKVKGMYAGLGFSQGFGKVRPMVLGLSVGYKFKESEWLSSTYYKKNNSADKGYQD